MDYRDVLLMERERYLTHFRSTAAKYIRTPGANIEVLFEVQEEDVHLFEKLYYADIVVDEDGAEPTVVDVDLETVFVFMPGKFTSAYDVEFELRPFAWNDCELHFQGTQTDWARIALWFDRWREPHPKDGAEGMFDRVVHSLTQPAPSDDGLTFSVDFGSSPIDSFEELLKVLSNIGATEIRVGYLKDPEEAPEE